MFVAYGAYVIVKKIREKIGFTKVEQDEKKEKEIEDMMKTT